MPAEILSLDLDWFNLYKDDLKFEIRHFFANLKRECKLPRAVDFVPEHHYLYPWSIKLLDGLSYRKANIVNIDEHHDFYNLGGIDFEDGSSEIGCWNFFAFMAHKKMIGSYTWVTNGGVTYTRPELMASIRDANSLVVRMFRRSIKVVNSSKVFEVLSGRKFEGFMIVRSPEYTHSYRSVYHAVEESLAKELPRICVRRYKCRMKFKSGRVCQRSQDLFWKI